MFAGDNKIPNSVWKELIAEVDENGDNEVIIILFLISL